MRPCLWGSRITHRNARVTPSNNASKRPLISRPPPTPLGRRRGFSNAAPRHAEHERGDPPSRAPRRRRPPLLLALLAGSGVLGAAAAALWLLPGGAGARRGSEHDDVLNRSTFSAFTIASREEVSPTAFVLTLRSSGSGRGSGKGKGKGKATSPRIRDAWLHGLWSVEVKQPQLQIARHYTPLPPPPPTSSSSPSNDGDDDEIRLLVRRVHGGEMSTYLSRLAPGDTVWLRGPHLGFDVARRLGLDGGGGGGGGGCRRDVVFLAAGTGIAPALQVARRLLLPPPPPDEDRAQAQAQAQPTESASAPSPPPEINITVLWANRRAVDALGRERAGGGGFRFLGWGFGTGGGGGGSTAAAAADAAAAAPETSSLERQIRDLQAAFPGRFRVRHFVDEEGTFVGARDVASAISSSSSYPPPPPPARQCPWHSPAALEGLPDDDDAGRLGDGANEDDLCPCYARDGAVAAPGSNLLFVSGPDGFIEALAGPKRWHAGGEMQGPVRGVLGRLAGGGGGGGGGGRRGGAGLLDGWLVLKL